MTTAAEKEDGVGVDTTFTTSEDKPDLLRESGAIACETECRENWAIVARHGRFDINNLVGGGSRGW